MRQGLGFHAINLQSRRHAAGAPNAAEPLVRQPPETSIFDADGKYQLAKGTPRVYRLSCDHLKSPCFTPLAIVFWRSIQLAIALNS
jgi:hypothetical protein